MDLKTCSKCGRIHPRSYECKKGYKREVKNKNYQILERSYAWTKKAKQIKLDAEGLCEVCRAYDIYTYDNLEVHHIVKVNDDPELLLDDENLICLCTYHHKQADAGEIEAEYLKKLVNYRQDLSRKRG